MGDRRGADDDAGRIPDGRDAEQDVDRGPVLAQAHGLGICARPRRARICSSSVGQLVLTVGRRQQGDGLADDLLGRVAVDALGAPVPGDDGAVEVLLMIASSADSTMRGQARVRLFRASLLGDVAVGAAPPEVGAVLAERRLTQVLDDALLAGRRDDAEAQAILSAGGRLREASKCSRSLARSSGWVMASSKPGSARNSSAAWPVMRSHAGDTYT